MSRLGKVVPLILLVAGGLAAGWVAISPSHAFLSGGSSPKLLVQPSELDLGQAGPGQFVTGTVTLKNVGQGTLQIDQVRASCACSSLHLDEKTLSPGQEVLLTVTAEVRKESQHVAFSVRIFSNDPETPEAVVLVRAAAAPPPIRTEPNSLDFSEVAHGSIPTQRLKLLTPDGKPWPASEPVVAKSATGLVVAECLPPTGAAPDAALVLAVRLCLSPDQPFGAFEDTLSIRPALSEHAIEIPVRGKMVPLYVVSPNALFFGDVDPHGSKTMKRRLVVRRTDGKPMPRMVKHTVPPGLVMQDTVETVQSGVTDARYFDISLDPGEIREDLKDGRVLLWLEGQSQAIEAGVVIVVRQSPAKGKP